MNNIIISLTTIPNRLVTKHHKGGLEFVIDKLLHMTYENYQIHLNVPFINKKTNEPYIIPDWLSKINDEKLKIFRTDDYGSLTKLLPTLLRLNENDETIIITVDDDLEYIDGFIEYHIKKREEYPNAAIGFAGLSSLNNTCHFCTTVKTDVKVKILEGYKTVSYKRNFFKDDFFTEFVGKSWNDDILISAYLGKHNIEKWVVSYDKDTDFRPRVESFPVVGHVPNEMGGCWWFRSESISDNSENWYKLGYLNR